MMKEFVGGMVQDIVNEGNKINTLARNKSADNLELKGKDRRNIFRKKEKGTPALNSPQRETSSTSSVNAVHGMSSFLF